jgi:hypothetical protein
MRNRRQRRETVSVDRIADAAWRARTAPFGGVTAFTETVPTTSLLAGVARLVDLLELAFPGALLQTAEDWLEHDGFVNEPQGATWSDLRAAVATREAFIDASPLDTYVRRAWLGRDSFYFRWHYYDEGDPPFAADPSAGGDLDVTADLEFIANAVQELAALGVRASTQEAATFFSDRWNG